MRQLRLVGLADDHSHLVLEAANGPDGPDRFALAPDPDLDAALRALTASTEPAASTEAPPEPAASATAPGRDLTVGPREIQVRVRAGESPEQVAEFYGVDVARIMRFAGPVLEERVRIAEEARRARAHRSKGEAGEGTLVVFGEAVDDRFTAHGIDASTVTWSTRRRDDGEWIVRAEWQGGRWAGGEGTHGAEWAFHRSSRSVTALDAAASDLLSDRPIRPVAPPERAALVSAPPLMPGVVAFPPMPEAMTDPLPAVEHVYDQEAPADGLRELGFLSDGESELGFEEPPLPLGITDPSTRPLSRLSSVRTLGGKREESEEERAARVKVPSWDDILLGVRRKQD
ncbi:septation protein SepH [uncultured Jatrophihabitans sp.]|uniref:septation protein SepH n=1 Tax=uncultured Jatrophihabitans sp. TaxID=1610747 RepID=UPI0035C963CF